MPKTSNRTVVPAAKTVFLVEDHPAFREGMVQILNGEADLIVCGAAGSAEEALPEIVRLKPDLALVDISLPGKTGLELIKEIRATKQAIKLLVISMHDEALYADRVLRAGGDGYIMKQEDPEEIMLAIRDVLNGHIYVSEVVLASLPATSVRGRKQAKKRLIDTLSDDELEILELLGRGRSNQEIAVQLGVDETAFEAQCGQLERKLNFKGRNELIRYAVCWVETGAN